MQRVKGIYSAGSASMAIFCATLRATGVKKNRIYFTNTNATIMLAKMISSAEICSMMGDSVMFALRKRSIEHVSAVAVITNGNVIAAKLG